MTSQGVVDAVVIAAVEDVGVDDVEIAFELEEVFLDLREAAISSDDGESDVPLLDVLIHLTDFQNLKQLENKSLDVNKLNSPLSICLPVP